MRLNQILNSVQDVYLLTESRGQLGLALTDFQKVCVPQWALVGGLAVGMHANPRATNDIDIILLNESDAERVKMFAVDDFHGINFRIIRPHALEHIKTGVEVEILTPEFLKVDPEIFKRAIETAITQNGIRVVSREGLVALKLQRGSSRDIGDIEEIIKEKGPVDLSSFPLSDECLRRYKEAEGNVDRWYGGTSV